MNRSLRLPELLLAIIALLFFASPIGAAEPPSDSIYRLNTPLLDQDGRNFRLGDRSGKVQLVSMFYTSCQYVCPLIIDTLHKTQAALPEADRRRVEVLLVTFDPERDTPQRLKEVFAQRQLDTSTWTLARTDAGNVRKLAAVLDVQYRVLASGDINHSSALTLLDADGRIVARTDKIGEVDATFVAAIHRALNPD